MRRILLAGALMLLAMGLILSCQSAATRPAEAATRENTAAPAAQDTAGAELCPLEKMGVTCPCGDGLCPAQEGKGPCNICATKAGQLAGLIQQWKTALQAQDYDRALKVATQMDEVVPNNSNIKASFALVYTLKGEYDKSLAIYNDMLKEFPDNPTLIGNIGNVYALKGDYDRALGIYNQLLVRYPDEPSIMNALASAYMKKGDYDRTLAIYNKMLQARPDDNIILYNVSCAYSLKGGKNEACEYLNKAVECGYYDWKHLEQDTDFNNIRSEPAYKKVLESLKAKYPEGLKSQAKKCDGTCNHEGGQDDPKCTGDCQHQEHKEHKDNK